LYYNIKFQKTPVFKITLSGDFLIYFFNLYFVVRLSMPYFFWIITFWFKFYNMNFFIFSRFNKSSLDFFFI